MNSNVTDRQTARCVIGAARIYLVVIVVLLLLVYGCKSPFATRKPESPTGEQVPLLEPTSAENVLRNLEISFAYMSIDDYLNTLSEGFLFLPDPSDKNSFPDVFTQPWSREKEAEFCNGLFDKASLIKFSSSVDSNAVVVEETAESVHYRYEYDVGIIHSTDAPNRVRGIAEFYLNSDRQGNWVISRWEDENTGTHSWGELRARF